MAGAVMNSMSDSVHASLIIQHQLKQHQEQLNVEDGAEPSQRKEESGKCSPSPQQLCEDKEAGQERGVGLCDQLMLVSALFGIEMSVSFTQMYEILMLQFFGVPLALVSVNGIVAGCFGMVFLPVVGAWSDGGKNPKNRKLITMFLALGIFGGGLVFLIVASLVKMRQIDNILNDLNNHTHYPYTKMASSPLSITESKVETEGYYTTPQQVIVNSTTTEGTLLEYASLPWLVAISILGFAGVDIGFDITVSISRALILENVPGFQQMRVLVLATIVQSSAGTSCSIIGCFDLPGFLGKMFQTDGAAATPVFFCCVILLATLTGFFLMSLAFYRLRKREKTLVSSSVSSPLQHSLSTSQISGASTSFNANAVTSGEPGLDKTLAQLNTRRDVKRKLVLGSQEQLAEERPYVPDILHTEEGGTSTRPLLFEDSLRVNYYSMINAVAPTTVTQDDIERNPLRLQRGNPVEDANIAPANSINASSDVENPTDLGTKARVNSHSVTFDATGVSTVLNAIRQSYSMSMSQRGGLGDFHARKLIQLREAQSKISAREKEAARRRTKVRLAVLCISTFFTIGASITCSVYSTNTFNLGIIHGDPTALPGTEGRERYEKGLQLGAIGNLIMYISFLAVSLSNNKIIETIGERGQFALFHLLLIVSLLTIICTQLVEVYFVFMVFAGAFRTCMLTLPFVLAHKFTQEGMSTEPVDPEQKVSITGRVMTLIGFLIPTHYMILSIVMGPLMQATGNHWVPLFYSLGSCSVSLGVFSILFFI